MYRPIRIAALVITATALSATIGCSKKPPPRPVESRPAQDPESRPSAALAPPGTPIVTTTPPVETASATRPTPETKPADALPESHYDSKPPYPVELFVRDPEQKQPGWLKILALSDENVVAQADGTFPLKNRILVDTLNVRQLRIHIGHLPIDKAKRTILRIDDQGIQLTHRNRAFIILERSPGGVWNVIQSVK